MSNNNNLESRFKLEFLELANQPINIESNALIMWCVCSSLQLALRHPGHNGPTADITRDFAEKMFAEIAPDGALKEVAERGWHSEYDEE